MVLFIRMLKIQILVTRCTIMATLDICNTFGHMLFIYEVKFHYEKLQDFQIRHDALLDTHS